MFSFKPPLRLRRGGVTISVHSAGCRSNLSCVEKEGQVWARESQCLSARLRRRMVMIKMINMQECDTIPSHKISGEPENKEDSIVRV